ncbi:MULTISPECIES: hypothetical protein [unclassified Streptomyces]|uniref:hypothetical protein n=1 Tax=unclassified Streptomyces TaxID=2593676 RepID=UPI0037FC9EB4
MTSEAGRGRADRHHKPAEASSAGGLAPQICTQQVATLTLGRQVFNDSDKSDYFEG